MNIWDKLINWLFLDKPLQLNIERPWTTFYQRLRPEDQSNLRLVTTRLESFCRQQGVPVVIMAVGSAINGCQKPGREPDSYRDIDLRLLPVRPQDERRIRRLLKGFICHQKEIVRDSKGKICSGWWHILPGYEFSDTYSWQLTDDSVPINFFISQVPWYGTLAKHLREEMSKGLPSHFALHFVDPLNQLPKSFHSRKLLSYKFCLLFRFYITNYYRPINKVFLNLVKINRPRDQFNGRSRDSAENKLNQNIRNYNADNHRQRHNSGKGNQAKHDAVSD